VVQYGQNCLLSLIPVLSFSDRADRDRDHLPVKAGRQILFPLLQNPLKFLASGPVHMP